MADEKDDRTVGPPIHQAFSHSPGSMASMSDSEIIGARVMTGVERSLVTQANKKVINMFASGDKVYHKEQKVEATYIGETKKPDMVLVKRHGKTFRVKRDKLVKL